MVKIIRWGIVGPGNIANKFAKAIKNVDGAKLVAVASRSEKSGREFAEKYNIPNVFVGYEEMAKSDIVDAVYIATPHPFHKSCAEMFLNAKKHVLCEKPICLNAQQAALLFECAKENGVFLMEAMWTRFLPAINEARSLIQNGKIGDVRAIEADFCYYCAPEEDGKIYRNDMAGGSLLDVGVYGLHFAAIFLGSNPESIVAAADVKDGVDYHTTSLLKYSDGAVASISSAIAVRKPESAYIYGSEGYIFFPCFYGASDFYVTVGDNTTHIEKPSVGDGFEEEIAEVCDCIRLGKNQSDVLPMSESIAVLHLSDTIRAQINLKYPFDGEDF